MPSHGQIENLRLTILCDSRAHVLCPQHMDTTFHSSLHIWPEKVTCWFLQLRGRVYFPTPWTYFGQQNASEMTLSYFKLRLQKALLTCIKPRLAGSMMRDSGPATLVTQPHARHLSEQAPYWPASWTLTLEQAQTGPDQQNCPADLKTHRQYMAALWSHSI